MRPHEALPQDWQLYYHNSFMLHETIGPVFVEVGGPGRIYGTKLTKGSTREEVKPEDLSVWFPLTGSFNITNTACYIARKAARQMRKSTTIGELYYVKKGKRLDFISLASILKDPNPHYCSFGNALMLIRKRKYLGRAISRDIMLLKPAHTNIIKVYFKGTYVGEVKGTKVLIYKEESPLRTFLVKKFMREGIACVSQTP